MSPRCGCDSAACACHLEGGDNVTVTGAGSELSPYVINVPSGGVGPTGPTGPAGPTGPTLGAQDRTFVLDAMASGATSPSVRLRFSKTLTMLAVTLEPAGSTDTVFDLLVNGVSVATITVPAATAEHDEVLAIAYVAEQKLALTVTTAGTGTVKMSADARFT